MNLNTTQAILTIIVAAFVIIGILAGLVIYFRKSLTDQLVNRYKEIHDADVERITQLEKSLNDAERRLDIVERENEVLRGLAIGRDLLVAMGESLHVNHVEIIGRFDKMETKLFGGRRDDDRPEPEAV